MAPVGTNSAASRAMGPAVSTGWSGRFGLRHIARPRKEAFQGEMLAAWQNQLRNVRWSGSGATDPKRLPIPGRDAQARTGRFCMPRIIARHL
ncbi:hypothetical protein D8B25_18950 [Verminephrobacter aporrectodeae subsp. tuberculatae]|nr:hypothetical protein [Verminephrobacter aporrectodeae subsp. tuberculatae]MCW8204803.1 hypothetical protein [Verminephrobacter aporrectodeae subsp. tuberculatae]